MYPDRYNVSSNRYKECIFDRYKERIFDRCTKSINGEELILNYIFQLINITLGFGDFHNTQTKLAPAQPFYRASRWDKDCIPITKTFKFLLFCYSNCEDRLLNISFLHFFISKLGYIFALSFCFQLLDTSQASSAMLQSEMMVDCILFDQWMTSIN